MNIELSDQPIVWGNLDVSLFGIERDWYEEKLDTPIAFALAADQQNLWFIASHSKQPYIHPEAKPGAFQPELWQYDVAEFFLLDEDNGNYLEFNLAPNGAWWSCEFAAQRQPASNKNLPLDGVQTYSSDIDEGGWLVAASIPLDILKSKFNFGDKSKMNVTFIINSPSQQFYSAAKLSATTPDFHLPKDFKQVTFFKNNA